jgi:hypothetical protein
VAQDKKRFRITAVFLLFVVYFFIASRPIPPETVLSPRWLSSLESDRPILINSAEQSPHEGAEPPLPFTLGGRFGYVDTGGRFLLNKLKTGEITLSENQWAEYEAEPEGIEIKNIAEETMVNINDPRGYPLLLDNRIFILGSEQNELSEIDPDGNILWTYDFGAPLTCIDAAAGLVLTGSIDGVIEILDSKGQRIFFFEPGGSRYSVILGCALSRNGSRLGIICGIDEQRFLLLERYGNMGGEYKVIYHEFLESGFRRPVYVLFIDQDRRIIFERSGGIGCYNIKSRQGIRIPLNGTIAAVDDSGEQGFFFMICSYPMNRKELIGIRFQDDGWLPVSRIRRDMRDMVVLRAPFTSGNVFLGRTNSMLVAGGGTTLVSFELEKK